MCNMERRLTHRRDSRENPLDTKSVMICADDFGLHPAIDAAIVELAACGRLSGAGCLVDGPSFAESAPGLLASGLEGGLHLNFTESLGSGGLFMPLGRLARACWARRLDPVAVRRQIACQLDRYEAVMGRAPDYVDGHQHVHQFPQIREALMGELDRRYPVDGHRPWLRSTRAGSQAGMAPGTRLKAAVIAVLGARRHGRLAQRHGYRLNRALLGVYDFQGGAAGYAGLLHAWLAAAGDGDLIMCHPAVRPVPGDPLGAQRQAEFDVWRSGETADWLRRFGVRVSRRAVCRHPAPGPAA